MNTKNGLVRRKEMRVLRVPDIYGCEIVNVRQKIFILPGDWKDVVLDVSNGHSFLSLRIELDGQTTEYDRVDSANLPTTKEFCAYNQGHSIVAEIESERVYMYFLSRMVNQTPENLLDWIIGNIQRSKEGVFRGVIFQYH